MLKQFLSLLCISLLSSQAMLGFDSPHMPPPPPFHAPSLEPPKQEVSPVQPQSMPTPPSVVTPAPPMPTPPPVSTPAPTPPPVPTPTTPAPTPPPPPATEIK